MSNFGCFVNKIVNIIKTVMCDVLSSSFEEKHPLTKSEDDTSLSALFLSNLLEQFHYRNRDCYSGFMSRRQ